MTTATRVRDAGQAAQGLQQPGKTSPHGARAAHSQTKAPSTPLRGSPKKGAGKQLCESKTFIAFLK